MVRTILAVIVGFLFIGMLITGTDQIFAFGIDGFDTQADKPNYYYLISIATDNFYSIIGGWVCATIAKNDLRRSANGLIILGELAGVASTVFLWKTVPHYYSFALLILYPPAVLFGSKAFEWTRPVDLKAK